MLLLVGVGSLRAAGSPRAGASPQTDFVPAATSASAGASILFGSPLGTAEPVPANINGSLNFDIVSASGFTGNATVTLTIRESPGGTQLGTGHKLTDGAGNAQFNYPQDHQVDLSPGMEITVDDGTITKHLTLVPLTITSVDLVTDVVAGTTVGGADVQVSVGDQTGGSSQTTTADSSGNWWIDFTEFFDITITTPMNASVADADGDATRVDKPAASIGASLTSDSISANNFASNGNVTFTIRQSPGGDVLIQESRQADSRGNVFFNRPQDHNIDLVPGMQITVDDGMITKHLTLVPLTITSVDATNDVVTGTASANAEVHVNMTGPAGWATTQVTAGGDGNWSVDFSPYDITYASNAGASVRDDDGDTTLANRGVAIVSASLTYDGINANGFAANANVNLTIRDAGGAVLDTASKAADAGGNVQFNRPQDHQVDLAPGMRLTVGDGTTTKDLTLAALAITSVNLATDTVAGTAPANAQVQVNVNGPAGGTGKQVTADGSGGWSAAFSPYDITYASNAGASVRDDDGDSTGVNRGTPIIEAWLDSDNVSANGFASGAWVSLTISDSPGGTVLAERAKQADGAGNAQFNRGFFPGGHDVDLIPGMEISVSDTTTSKVLILAALTITSVNPATDVVAGTAPANAQVRVQVNDPAGSSEKQATAGGNGAWSASLLPFDFTYAANAFAHVPDNDGDTTAVEHKAPTIIAWLEGDNVAANGFASNANVSLTIRAPNGTLLDTANKTADARGNAQFNRPQDHQVDLVPGMQVTVSDGTTTKNLTLAALAITSVNPATNVVAGTAPPSAQVQVGVGNETGWTSQTKTADSFGNWSIDFSPFDITYSSGVNASVSDGDYDSTQANRGTTTINASLTGDTVFANGFAGNAELTLTIRDSGGGVLGTAHSNSDAGGNAQFDREQGHQVDLAPGMQVTVSDGTTTKNLTLAALAITLVNPATDVVAGTAPPNAEVRIDINEASRTVTAGSDGNWSVDFSPFDITYAMWANAYVRDDDGDTTCATRRPPVVHASLTEDNLMANGFANNAPVTLTIRDSGGGVLDTATKSSDASGSAEFYRYQDHQVDLASGMQITVSDGTSTKDLTLAALVITTVDPATDVVAGTAPANAQLQVHVNNEGGGTGTQVTSDSNGNWSVDFTGDFDITYGSGANVSVGDDDGDTTGASHGTPTINASLTWNGITANGFPGNANVTYTVFDSPGGAVIDTGNATTDGSGYAEFGAAVNLLPGMVITVTDGATTKELTLAALTITSVDPVTDTVAGTAPAGAHVFVNVNDPDGWAEKQVTAGSDGNWSADFSPFDITYASGANASVSDSDGDATGADHAAPTIDASLTYDNISANGFAGHATVTFTIRDLDGTVLDSGPATTDASGYAEFNRYEDYDIELLPGMTIEASDGTITKELTLVELAITSVNPMTDIVAGTAPPNSEIQVYAGDETGEMSETTNADDNGNWTIDFSPFDITYTMLPDARVADDDGDTTSAEREPPTIHASVSYNGISANGFANNALLTFTVRDLDGTVRDTGSAPSDENGSAEFGSAVNLVPGMRITVGDGTITKDLTLAAVAISSVDPASDTVAGTAPANAQVQVHVDDPAGWADTEVTAGSDGTWSADFSAFDITYSTSANARVAEGDGDTTEADKGAPRIWGNLTNDSVASDGFANNASINFTISQPPGGTVLDTGSRTSDANGYAEFDTVVDLLPGMEITVSDGTTTKHLTLAALAITSVDPATDVVAGTAPADARVQVNVGDETAGDGRETVAGAGGNWSIDFTPFDVTATMEAVASVTDTDGDTTSTSSLADTTPPVTTIDSGPAGLTNDSTPTFTFHANEPASFQCRIDTAAFATCSTPYTSVALSDGLHTFEVRATDTAGNQGSAASRAFTVDTTSPIASVDSGPSGPTNDTTPTFTFHANEPASFQCRIDTAAFATCSTPYTSVALSDGLHTFEVRATDTAGNQGLAASRTFTVDTAVPVTTIDSGPSGVTNDSTPTFTFHAGEPADFQCRVDTAPYGPCTSPHTTAALADGPHTFDVIAIDSAGNVGSAASRNITVDTGAPVTTIDSGPTGLTNDSTPTFTFHASEPATFECRVDTAAFAACSSPYTSATLSDGADTFEVRATDTLGNQGSAASRTFTVHTGVPLTTVDSGPSGLTNDSTPTFTFSADEAATFQCRVDSGAFAACVSPYTTAVLGDAAHTFEVRATDAAGNQSSAASRAFTVHTGAPVITVESGPAALTNDSTPTFTFSADEAATFQCRVDSVAFAACSSPYTTAVLSDGAHSFEVRATDAAGNQSAAVSRAFTVDTISPETTIDSGPSGPTSDPTPTFAFSATEAGATFECRVDAATFTACSSPYTTVTLALGLHRFEVRAVDSLGNADATPAAREFSVQVLKPAKATLVLISRSVTVSRARVAAVKLRCGTLTQCRGTLSLSATVNGRLVGSHASRVKVKLGSRSFSIAAGRTATVNVKLSVSGYKLLVKVKRLAAQARISYKQPAGGTTTLTRAITLRAPAKR